MTMELNSDLISNLINQIKKQGAIALTLSNGTKLIANWQENAEAFPSITIRVVPPQAVQSQGNIADIYDNTRAVCPDCNGTGWVDDVLGHRECVCCNGQGWVNLDQV